MYHRGYGKWGVPVRVHVPDSIMKVHGRRGWAEYYAKRPSAEAQTLSWWYLLLAEFHGE